MGRGAATIPGGKAHQLKANRFPVGALPAEPATQHLVVLVGAGYIYEVNPIWLPASFSNCSFPGPRVTEDCAGRGRIQPLIATSELGAFGEKPCPSCRPPARPDRQKQTAVGDRREP